MREFEFTTLSLAKALDCSVRSVTRYCNELTPELSKRIRRKGGNNKRLIPLTVAQEIAWAQGRALRL